MVQKPHEGQQSSVVVFDDDVIVFTPSRPFLEKVETDRRAYNALGLNIVYATGFGFGFFYQRDISPAITLAFDTFFTDRRNASEMEISDYRLQRPIVPGKVNRLFAAPIMFSMQYRPAAWEISDAVRVFVQGGIGPSLVISTPYIRDGQFYEFFNSFSEADYHVRLGGFVGVGASISPLVGSMANFYARYYLIPFGGEGLESMNPTTTNIPPIKDFGGFFVGMSVGFKF